MVMGISISHLSSVIIFDDLMLSALKIVFRIAQNNNVKNVIPNENTNFAFEFSEFKFSEFEYFGSISHSSISHSILLVSTHEKVYTNLGIHQLEKTRNW